MECQEHEVVNGMLSTHDANVAIPSAILCLVKKGSTTPASNFSLIGSEIEATVQGYRAYFTHQGTSPAATPSALAAFTEELSFFWPRAV